MQCRYCHQPIAGAKGDYWHVNAAGDIGPMRCAWGSQQLAAPAPAPVHAAKAQEHGVGADLILDAYPLGNGPEPPSWSAVAERCRAQLDHATQDQWREAYTQWTGYQVEDDAGGGWGWGIRERALEAITNVFGDALFLPRDCTVMRLHHVWYLFTGGTSSGDSLGFDSMDDLAILAALGCFR